MVQRACLAQLVQGVSQKLAHVDSTKLCIFRLHIVHTYLHACCVCILLRAKSWVCSCGTFGLVCLFLRRGFTFGHAALCFSRSSRLTWRVWAWRAFTNGISTREGPLKSPLRARTLSVTSRCWCCFYTYSQKMPWAHFILGLSYVQPRNRDWGHRKPVQISPAYEEQTKAETGCVCHSYTQVRLLRAHTEGPGFRSNKNLLHATHTYRNVRSLKTGLSTISGLLF